MLCACALMTGMHADGNGSGSRSNDSDWEVVEKADTLRGAQSYVGPATFANTLSANPATTQPSAPSDPAQHGTQAAPLPVQDPLAVDPAPPRQQGSASASGDASPSQPGSSTAPRGRVLTDAARRRKEAQEAAALKLQVAEENVKDAIITVQWPYKARHEPCTAIGRLAARPHNTLPSAHVLPLAGRISLAQ